MMTLKKIKNCLANLTLLLLSLLLSLVIAEVSCRYFYFGKLPFKAVSPNSKFWISHETLGWFHKSSAEGFFFNAREQFNGQVQFDEIGIRVNDNPSEYEKISYKKVLVVGDSTTAGFEVDNNETYVSVLERLFYSNSCNYRFYNAGVRGYGTDQALWVMQELTGLINPDYIIYMFSPNDITNNRTIKRAHRIFSKPAFVLDNNKFELVNYPPKKYNKEYYSYIDDRDGVYRINEGYLSDGGVIVEEIKSYLRENMALYYPVRTAYDYFYEVTFRKSKLEQPGELTYDVKVLKHILHKMKKVNNNLILTLFTTGRNNTTTYYNSILNDLASELDFLYLDISPYFNDRPMTYHWKTDGHWNEKGHYTASKALYELLKTNLCKKGTSGQ